MTPTPSRISPSAALEQGPPASKTIHGSDTSPPSTRERPACVGDTLQAATCGCASLFLAPLLHPPERCSGVQSPYPRKPAV